MRSERRVGIAMVVGGARFLSFSMSMKKIKAYINTLRVHWVVEELQAKGVTEIMVTEYFRPLSQISRLEFCCEDHEVKLLSEVVHSLGTLGQPPDHNLSVEEFDPALPSQIPLGKRVSRLEESRIKQLIGALLGGVPARLSLGYLAITLSIVLVGLYMEVRTGELQEQTRAARENMRSVSDATQMISGAVIGEMLAVDRLHRGESDLAKADLDHSRDRLDRGVFALRSLKVLDGEKIDSLSRVEMRLRMLVEGMFSIVPPPDNRALALTAMERRQFPEHERMMASMNSLHLEMMDILYLLQGQANELAARQELESDAAVGRVRLSMVALAFVATIISILTWMSAQRRIGRPLSMILREANAVDNVELR